nr:serine/threonine protein kinase [Deltaproteobacteria bacterium]
MAGRLDEVADHDQRTLAVVEGGAEPLDLGDMLGQTLVDRFELRSVLGHGRHGTVFEAYDRRLDHRVALKVLAGIEPDALPRFKREFRSLADVAHPNLVTLYELFVDVEAAFFTMELIDGGDVLSWVRGPDGVDPSRLRQALVGLAHGLGALHGHGVVHRDLKPSNVLVRADGSIALVDFGL